MKHFISLATLLISTQITFAQTEKINLSDYKLPEMKRHQLDLSVNSYGNSEGHHQIYAHIPDTVWLKSNDYQWNGNLTYSNYRNTKRLQSTMSASLNSYGYSRNTEEAGIEIDKTNTFRGSLTLNYDTKLFDKNNRWFITGVPFVNLAYYNSENDSWNSDKSEQKYFSKSASFQIGGGIGRIEQVGDLRHAILILSELQDRGKLSRESEKAETIELAELISKLKNLRFFDSRKRKEANLVTIDSFLVSKGLVTETDISYFTGLEDIWVYGDIFRESGNQLILTANPYYMITNNDYTPNYFENDKEEDFLMSYLLKYISRNPISIKWQMDYDLGIRHSSTRHLQQLSSSSPEKLYYSSAYVKGTLGYYPNTRTYLSLSGETGISNQNDKKALDSENYSLNYSISGNTYYYISERLRLNLSLRYGHALLYIFNSDIPNLDNSGFYYSFSFNYAIF